MERKYCPSCGQDVDLEASLEGSYVLHACRICGLGLGIKIATTQEVARFKNQGLPEPPVAMPSPGGSQEAHDSREAARSSRESAQSSRETTTGPLAKVGTVKRSVPLQPVVERPAPPDPRSESSHDGPGASSSMSIDTTNTQMPAIRPGAGGVPAIGGPVRQMRRVFVAEDSTFLREVARDLLTQRHLAREVVDCPDGSAFLEAFTRACDEGQKPDLVVLDVRMPGLDGRETAFAMRAIEAGFQVPKKTPILFFSAVLCDDRFKRILQKLGNAKYIRKTDGGDVQELGERIVAVLERLVGGRKPA